jgi:hypothetical protein
MILHRSGVSQRKSHAGRVPLFVVVLLQTVIQNRSKMNHEAGAKRSGR